MKKVYQRIDDPRHGDCYKCCIAAILDLDYEDVPHFIEMGEDWLVEAQKFFREYGYKYTGEELYNPNIMYLETRLQMFGRTMWHTSQRRSAR